MLIVRRKWLVFIGGILACGWIFVTPDLKPLFLGVGCLIGGIGMDLNIPFFNKP